MPGTSRIRNILRQAVAFVRAIGWKRFVSLAAAGYVTYQATRPGIWILPSHVPPPIEQQFGSDALTNQIRDVIDSVYRLVPEQDALARKRVALVSEQPDFEIPGSKISLRSVIRWIRAAVGFAPTTYTTEIEAPDMTEREKQPRRLKVWLRRTSGSSTSLTDVFDVEASLGDVAREISRHILRREDPLALASFLYFWANDRNAAAEIIDGMKTVALTVRGRTLTLRALILADDNKLDESDATFREAALAAPDDYRIYWNWCGVLEDMERFDRASTECAHAISLNPTDAHVYISAANVLREQRQFDRASSLYEKALAIEPRYGKGYFEWGRLFDRKKEYDRAIDLYFKALASNPKLIEAYVALGTAFEARGEVHRANASFLAAADLTPTEPIGYIQVGAKFGRQGRPEARDKMYAKAFAVCKKTSASLVKMGDDFASVDADVQAFKAYGEASDMDPKNAVAHLRLGAILSRYGRPELAVKELREGVRLNPSDSTGYALLGQTFVAQENFQEAATALKDAVRLDPNDAPSQNNLSLQLSALSRCG